MILHIDTTDNAKIELALIHQGAVAAALSEPAERQQAEKLLPAIERLLKKAKVELAELESIKVNNHGGSFTSLRIGVVTANALAFALGISVAGVSAQDSKKRSGLAIVEPVYASNPQITVKKPRL
jgi:tRNA threonylcarbamoyladenosine biosynthesis protein TsaB